MKHIILIILIVIALGSSIFLIVNYVPITSKTNLEVSELDFSNKLLETTDQSNASNTEEIINKYTWVAFEHPSAPFAFEYPKELSISPGLIWDEFPSYVTSSISLALDDEEAQRIPHKQILITVVNKNNCLEVPHHPHCPDPTELSKSRVKVMGYQGYVYEGVVSYGKDYSNVKRYVFSESNNTYMLTYYKDYSTDKTELQEPNKEYEIIFDRIASSFQIHKQTAAKHSGLSAYLTNNYVYAENENWVEGIWHVSRLKIKYQYPANSLEDINERLGFISKAFYEKKSEPRDYNGSHISFTERFSVGYFPQEVLGMIDGKPEKTATIAGQPGYVKQGTISRLNGKNTTQVKVYTFEKDSYVYIFAYYKGEGKDFSDTFDGIVSSLEIVN
jgi:hypothetical protein